MRGDDPRWGCIEPGCDAHPANPENGTWSTRLAAMAKEGVLAYGTPSSAPDRKGRLRTVQTFHLTDAGREAARALEQDR